MSMRLYVLACVLFTVVYFTRAQLPPRLAIPGAVLLSQPNRPRQRIQQQAYLNASPQPVRIRKPIPNAIPLPVRPVVEEPEDSPEQEISSNFDDEVAKLGISSLQAALGQADTEEEEETPRPVQFRPERPLPVLRQDVRESRPAPLPRPPPIPATRPQPIFRDNVANIRPPPRQELREEPVFVRRPSPSQSRPVPIQQAPQPIRQTIRANPPPRQQQASQYIDDDDERRAPSRNRKPPVQILRKYRTDNEDGSITWGFENEDGTFKEETIGIDCITRGVYGYTDPDGVKREYNYETGAKCEDPEEELAQEPEQVVKGQLPQKGSKKLYRLPA